MDRVRRSTVAGLVPCLLVLGFMLLGASPALASKVVWLCKPGQRPDPCTPGLATTVYAPRFKQPKMVHPKQVKRPTIDCFYVYPTVSNQKGPLANLHIDPAERSIALYQAARYSQYCRVFAPIDRKSVV